MILRFLPGARLALLFLSAAACSHSAIGACQFAKVAQLPVSLAGGLPIVEGSINGVALPLLFDTGASTTSLTRHATEKLGLELDAADGHFYGVGGISDNYAASLREFAIGPLKTSKISLHVIGDQVGGTEFAALVGADFALQMDLEVAMKDKFINFFRTSGCDDAFLGYWDKDALEVPMVPQGPSDKRAVVVVELNGVKINAIVDTGASGTVITRKAALAAGFREDGKGVVPTSDVHGIGKKRIKSWNASFDFKLGDEIIQHARLTVMNDEFSLFEDAQMLLGQDWLRAHRVLFARSQKRMIFSYLGGDVFP